MRPPSAASDDLGPQMLDLVERLLPICRSITGDGVRETLRIIGETIDLDIREVPSGTPVLDWTVPGWTSAETLINYLLDVQDYGADVVVIQQAYGDVEPRLWPDLKPDYSHYREPWRRPRAGRRASRGRRATTPARFARALGEGDPPLQPAPAEHRGRASGGQDRQLLGAQHQHRAGARRRRPGRARRRGVGGGNQAGGLLGDMGVGRLEAQQPVEPDA